MEDKKYIVVVQCHIVKERCSGYLCEYAFNERAEAFDIYSKNTATRFLPITCGGCCGRAVHRKLMNLIKQIKKKESLGKDDIVVHLSSCISFDSYHALPCPHIDYLKNIISVKLGLNLVEGTRIGSLTEKRRKSGKYISRETCNQN